MPKVALVNVPFAGVERPSLSLTQLRAVVRARTPEVDPKIVYANLDFGRMLGLSDYQLISMGMESLVSGLGDWFFRPAAFPSSPEDGELYHKRYLRSFGARSEGVKKLLREWRENVPALVDSLIERYQLATCGIVGFTSTFQQNGAAFAFARRIKARNPDVIVVMGGANCESSMAQAIARNVEVVDFVFSGPSLVSFPELVARVAAGDLDSCHDIRGVLSKRKLESGRAVALNEVGDDLPIDVDVALDYDDYFAAMDERFPRDAVKVSLLFETSRGCWWGAKAHCTFCGLNGMTMDFRGMEPKRARERLDSLITRYGDRVARFEAVDNIMPREYLTELFPSVRSPKTIFYEVKADLADSDMEILARAGVTEIQPGIEALATSTLKLMRKGTTAFQNLRFLKSCLTQGIAPVWNLLVGFPGEEEATYARYSELLPRLAHLHPPTGVYPVRFDRFSPYFDRANEYGLKLKPYDFYGMIYPFPAPEVEKMAYYFYDEKYDAPYFASMVRWIQKLRERHAQWRQRWSPRPGELGPRLRFEARGGSRIVSDTRSGSEVEHHLEEEAMRILESLSGPKKPPGVAAELSLQETAVAKHLERLDELGLVFREGDSYLSLVVEPRRESVDGRGARDVRSEEPLLIPRS